MKKTIKIVIDGEEFIAPLRSFKHKKTGYGVYNNVSISGEEYRVTCNIVKTIKPVKSKPIKFEKFLNKI